MLRRVFAAFAVVFGLIFGASAAQARVDIRVDLSTQRMTVTTPDGETYNWAVSSGREGYRTIRGSFRPTRLERHWHSRKYDGPMPHSIFFRGGFAIHGTSQVGRLGRPASHGCVRLAPGNAARLFALVQKHRSATRIAIHGVAPDTGTRYAKAKPSQAQRVAAARAKPSRTVQPVSDWQTARDRVLERDSFFNPGVSMGFQPVQRQDWRLRR
jgi:hypothetical protein